MPNPCECCKKACPNESCQCKCGENCNCGTDCKCCPPKSGDAKSCCGGKPCTGKGKA